MEVFQDRRDAGGRLADALADHEAIKDADRIVVLAIPRGGLPVGSEIAQRLGAALDVVMVRKLRAPHNPELGFGAVGSDGHVEVNEDLAARIGVRSEQLEAEVADRRRELERRLALYRGVRDPVPLEGAVVIVVDDGIATGGTAREACALARRSGAERVILAVPVGPPRATDELADAADDIVILAQPDHFMAVGQAYRDFAQLDDEDVLAVLRDAPG
jgi:putative phosphoribosyl transferase